MEEAAGLITIPRDSGEDFSENRADQRDFAEGAEVREARAAWRGGSVWSDISHDGQAHDGPNSGVREIPEVRDLLFISTQHEISQCGITYFRYFRESLPSAIELRAFGCSKYAVRGASASPDNPRRSRQPFPVPLSKIALSGHVEWLDGGSVDGDWRD